MADLLRTIEDVQAGDVLLFRPGRSAVSRVICGAGRGRYSHVALAALWGGDLMSLEVREWHGGRAVLLAREVARRPGLIDVYRINRGCNRLGVVERMRRLAGSSYGYISILRAALYHLPVVRMLLRPMTDDEMENGRPPYCSQAIAWAFRTGSGIDLVPNAADCMTEPSDLARSALLSYQFTLRP